MDNPSDFNYEPGYEPVHYTDPLPVYPQGQPPPYILRPLSVIVGIIILVSRVIIPYVLRDSPSSPKEAAFRSGMTKLSNGDYKNAVLYFTSAIASDNNYTEAYNSRGFVYFLQNKYDLALTDYQKVIKLLPDKATPYNNRGVIYGSLDNYENALMDFNKALSINPKFSIVYFNRGMIYSLQKNYNDAIADFDKAFQYAREASKKGDESNPPIGEPLESIDLLSIPYVRLADVYAYRAIPILMTGSTTRAQHDLNNAISIQPDYATAYYFRGLIYHQTGDDENAINDFNKVVDLNNDQILVEEAKARLAELGNK